MKILVLNGVNLNMLGVREKDIYGTITLDAINSLILEEATKLGVEVVFKQDNVEGELVNIIHQAYFNGTDGILFNPGAYTHTSIALLDALKAVQIPTVEVHLSNIYEREEFRKISYIKEACIASVYGLQENSYLKALHILVEYLNK